MVPVQIRKHNSNMRRKSERYPVVYNGIFIIKVGTLLYQDKVGESISLSAGDFLLFSSGDISKLKLSSATGSFEAESIDIDVSLFQKFVSYSSLRSSPKSSKETFVFTQEDLSVVSLVSLLKEQIENDINHDTLEFLTLATLSEMVSIHPELMSFIDKISALTTSQQLIRYVENNISSDLTIDTVAPKLGMSASTLKRKLQGDKLSFANLVKVKRINYAATQLRITQKTITEIAYETGFKTAAHFSTSFKSITGITPKEFREQIRR